MRAVLFYSVSYVLLLDIFPFLFFFNFKLTRCFKDRLNGEIFRVTLSSDLPIANNCNLNEKCFHAISCISVRL